MQKEPGLKLVLFTWNGRTQGRQTIACASPVTLQILFSGLKFSFVHCHVGSLQDTNLGLS
jgi:hypothetical protein